MESCKAVRIVEIIICVMILILVAAAAFPSYWIDLRYGSSDFDVHGASLEYDVCMDVSLGTVYDFDDVDIAVRMVDDARGSMAPVNSTHVGTLYHSSDNRVHLKGSVFIPTALLMLRDFTYDDSSPVVLRVHADFGYMMGLLDVSVDTDLVIPLSDDGDNLTVENTENSDTAYVLSVSGLRKSYTFGDAELLITDGTHVLSVSLQNAGPLILRAESSDLDGTIDGLEKSDSIDVFLDGESYDMDIGTVRSFLGALDYARGL